MHKSVISPSVMSLICTVHSNLARTYKIRILPIFGTLMCRSKSFTSSFAIYQHCAVIQLEKWIIVLVKAPKCFFVLKKSAAVYVMKTCVHSLF